MTIEEILAGESKNVEFKVQRPDKSIKYMKSVVAFANGKGGRIVFWLMTRPEMWSAFQKIKYFRRLTPNQRHFR